jgi:UDP-N-acetylglucosamine--N-acetylmuramyl-(pentapeptide) pyrophosphoryl-undecaprenol N-acetylglucosamine transferase
MDDLKNEYAKLGIKATLVKFIHNIAEEMAKVQLVICRSGASTLAELSALGRPAILIPYPSASENHQFHNAMYYKNKGAAWIVEENATISQELSLIITNILNNRELLKLAASNMINESICGSTDVFVEYIERLVAT